MRHHNPLRQRGIGPSLTCRVGICWIRPYGNPCNSLASRRETFSDALASYDLNEEGSQKGPYSSRTFKY